MRTFIPLIAASVAVAFAPPPRQLLSPATTQMTTAATAAPVAPSRAVHKSNCAVHAIDATSARRRGGVHPTDWLIRAQVARVDGAGGRAQEDRGHD